jgi:Major intrinsic protein
MIYAWGPLSGLHINPAVTLAFASRRVFPAAWVVPYWLVQFAGAICAALFLQVMFGDVSAGGNYPITTPGGEWKSLVMETVLTAILVSVILNTATGGRSIGHNAAIAVGSTGLVGLRRWPGDRRRHRRHDHRTGAGAAGQGGARGRRRRRPPDPRQPLRQQPLRSQVAGPGHRLALTASVCPGWGARRDATAG